MPNTPTIKKIRADWYQAIRIINGKTFFAFGKSAKVASILLNKQLAQEKKDIQGTLPL